MKKLLINGIIGAGFLLLGFSCTKTDNIAGPDSGFQGNIIDSVTGKNLITETGGVQIELKQLSWSNNPTPYYIPSKPDGSFEDTRIFSGNYSVIPTQGAFWPVDSAVVNIKGSITKSFTVVPYLEITNVTHTLNADSLVMTFQLQAPRTNGLPQIIDATEFVNNTPFVGSGAFIQSFYNESSANVSINSNWSPAIGATTYRTVVHNLQSGWTYYARIGVRLNDSYKKYDLSDMVQVAIPSK
ncbi:MAG TPA: DUF3823 domain-containing protein [Puia sp.]|nr:DUF3823 domain-containing protein [Puia sp.]